MKTLVMHVSPAQASEWLKANTNNRTLREGHVSALMSTWARGEWKLTHQGIAFDKAGVLKDGQHRLTFISRLPSDALVPLMVTFDIEDDTFGVIDNGARRTIADEMRINPSMAAVVTILCRLANSNQSRRWTVAYQEPVFTYIADEFDALQSFCGTLTSTFSSAAVRAAAIVMAKRGHDFDFIKGQYRALVLSDFDLMTPCSRALFKQAINGKVRASAHAMDLFCRATIAFTKAKRDITRIQIDSAAEMSADFGRFLSQDIPLDRFDMRSEKSPHKGGQKVSGANCKSARKRGAA